MRFGGIWVGGSQSALSMVPSREVVEIWLAGADVSWTVREGRLNRIQMPRGIVFVESLPRSEAGKLLRRILKEEYRTGSGAGTLWPCGDTREPSIDKAALTK